MTIVTVNSFSSYRATFERLIGMMQHANRLSNEEWIRVFVSIIRHWVQFEKTFNPNFNIVNQLLKE